jgi:hypothetical protein
MHLQLHIFRLQYSFERICPAIVHISTIQCSLYCKLGDNYIAHPPAFSMWTVARTHTKYLQLRIFMLQYSAVGICAAIVDITKIQCALYSKHGAKYSAHPPAFAMWTVVPDIYNAFTAPHIQTSIFIWTYLRSNWKYLDNSMRITVQIGCQI